MKAKRIISAALVFALMLAIGASVAQAKYGLSIDEIKTIQRKLKNWGYYDGAVDGDYGAGTTAAVKSFQKKNGLSVDGIVGAKTAEKLGMQLSGTSGADKDAGVDVYLVARVIYGEARGEPYKGKVAVGAIVLNRVKHPDFPNTLKGVVYQKHAFSIVADGQINLTPDADALKAARDAVNGVDPTSGCLYYYNPDKTQNKWIRSREVRTVIGQHYFCL